MTPGCRVGDAMSGTDDDDLRIIGEGWPISFRPSACGACNCHCCRGESGAVWITEGDVSAIARTLGLSRQEVMRNYVRSVPEGLALKEVQLSPSDYPCVFLDLENQSCGIYEARPQQCRTFPFWDYFKTRPEEARRECPGVEDGLESSRTQIKT